MGTDLDLVDELHHHIIVNPGSRMAELVPFFAEYFGQEEIMQAFEVLLRSKRIMAVPCINPDYNPKQFCRYYSMAERLDKKPEVVMPEVGTTWVMGGLAYWVFMLTCVCIISAFIGFIVIMFH